MNCSTFVLGCLILSAAACKQNKEIKVYRVARDAEPATQPAADPHAGVPGMAPGAAGADPHAGVPGMAPGAAGADPHAGLTPGQMGSVGAGGSPQVTDSPPSHWKKMPLSSMRRASYQIEGEGGTSVDVSLVILRGAAGGTLDNVNRWRGQLGQPALDEAALKQSAKPLVTPLGEALMVSIEGLAPGADPAKDGRMIGVIANSNGDAWFYKMRGNAALTESETANFTQWVASVKPE